MLIFKNRANTLLSVTSLERAWSIADPDTGWRNYKNYCECKKKIGKCPKLRYCKEIVVQFLETQLMNVEKILRTSAVILTMRCFFREMLENLQRFSETFGQGKLNFLRTLISTDRGKTSGRNEIVKILVEYLNGTGDMKIHANSVEGETYPVIKSFHNLVARRMVYRAQNLWTRTRASRSVIIFLSRLEPPKIVGKVRRISNCTPR